MITMAGFELPLKAMRQQIASAVDLVIQANRLQGGPRKITHITEIVRHGTGHDRDARHLSLFPGRDRRKRPATAASNPPASGPRSWTGWNQAGVRLPASAFRQRVMLVD